MTSQEAAPAAPFPPTWLACRDRAHRPQWFVRVRQANYSTFNGGKRTASAYSEVVCLECPCSWRTKGAYVAELPGPRPTPELVTRALLRGVDFTHDVTYETLLKAVNAAEAGAEAEGQPS
jgi:hypothetical protein